MSAMKQLAKMKHLFDRRAMMNQPYYFPINMGFVGWLSEAYSMTI
jgi:hypothetical protein